LRLTTLLAVAPKILELSKELDEKKGVFWCVVVAKTWSYLLTLTGYRMDIEDGDAENVAQEYSVRAVPCFMLFKDGDMLPEKSVLGPHPQQVKAMIEANIKA
jgi:thiol-disulfide isomerase/thioredoxin